ncbi:protease B [Cystobacter fuscus DSM 2262]|uniref:Protease B n=2 Tax=Cystobacter fuscus TaxID=43 RepID=S9P6H4_CYSF2|nr:protease B [Cystobacter fuscus DSM 2262]
MARTPSTGCSFTINAVLQPGMVGGSAGFPSGGLPYSTINIGAGLASYSVDVIEHVITHELGHTIGFRHTDYYNRSISCGSGGNEGDAGVGAIHIPGTPTRANVGGSLMNSCFRSVETGEFASSDITALKALYLAQNSAWQSAPQFTPPFHLSSDTVGDLGGRFVDLNGDGRADFAYYRWIDGSNQQAGAYLNTAGTGAFVTSRAGGREASGRGERDGGAPGLAPGRCEPDPGASATPGRLVLRLTRPQPRDLVPLPRPS